MWGSASSGGDLDQTSAGGAFTINGSGLAFGGGAFTFNCSFGGGFGLGMAFGGGLSGGRGISVEDPDGKPGSCILGGGRSGGGQCGRSGSLVRLAMVVNMSCLVRLHASSCSLRLGCCQTICGSSYCTFFGGVQGCRVSM